MALSGTFYGATTNDRVKPKIVWSAAQSVAGNYSDVTAALYYSRTNTGYETAGLWEGSITIDGNTKTGSRNISVTYDSDTLAITHTVRVEHDSYGGKRLIISASGSIGVSSVTETNIRATLTLDTIARAASVSAANGDIGSRVTVVADRKNAAYTHSLQYDFGAERGFIRSDGSVCDQEEKMTAAAVNFLIPESFYDQIPNSPSGVCVLTCRTYSGSSLVGTSSSQFTVTANRSVCAPSVTGRVEDVNEKTLALTGNSAVLVSGQSNAKCTVTATAKNGATVVQKQIGGVAVSGTSRAIEGAEPGSILFSVTDSRGYQSKTAVEPAFIPYVKLTCNPTLRRTAPTSGAVRLILKGRCYRGSFGAKENALQISYRLGSEPAQTVSVPLSADHSYSAAVTLENVDYTQSYTVTVTAADALSSVTKNLRLERGEPVFDWGKGDFRFHVPAYGNFVGSLGGMYVRTIEMNGSSAIDLQSRYGSFSSEYASKQPVFLFGTVNKTPVYGMLTVLGSGEAPLWSGQGAVTATALSGGKVQLTLPGNAWDAFAFLSPYPIEILQEAL